MFVKALKSATALAAVVLATACTEAKDAKPNDPAKADPSAAGQPVATEPKKIEIEVPAGTGPVATVNGAEVSRETFNAEYRQTLERYQRARHEVQPALRERLKDNIVRRLVDAELVAQQAKAMGVEVADAEREEKWKAHKARYGSEESFKAFLERAGTSELDVRRQFESNLLREKLFEKVAADVKVTDAEIKEFYEQNKERYDEPEQVRASHILIRVDRDAKPEDKAKKKALADDVVKKAKAKGADFAALAKEFGEDPTKDRGGDLGFFTKGRMVKPFEDVAWKLKTSEVSGVVETQFGYHIIKKMEHQKARKKNYAEVKEQIERSLQARKRNQAIRDALNKWKTDAKIEIFVKGDEKIIEESKTKPMSLQGGPSQIKTIENPALKLATERGLDLKKAPGTETRDTPVQEAAPAPTP